MAQEEIIFPNNIRNIRLAKGMKMTELARKSNLSLSAVSKIEKGVRRLNQKQLLNICSLLSCKLSDIFIHETDEGANKWQSEITRRLVDNEDSGLKIFGSGLRKIRQQSNKTIEEAAKASKMTLSVYHKIEVGQREVYENEIDILAKAFGLSTTELFDKIATLYKSGELNKQINKTKERVKSVLNPTNPRSGLDFHDGLYGAQLYDNARKKLIPVFGTPEKNSLKFIKSDENMINAPVELEGNSHIYAVIPNTKRTGNFIPAKSYVFVDAKTKPSVGDLAVAINTNFSEMKNTDTAVAQLVYVCKDNSGKLYGKITNPDEKITAKTMHKVIMITIK